MLLTPPILTSATRPDPVAVIARFVAEMERHAERAATAAREGRAVDALRAAGAMQMLLHAQSATLSDALAAARSKRVPLETRLAVRKAVDGALAPLRRSVRVLEAQAKARQARQAAIGEALRAAASVPAPARSYAALGRVAGTKRAIAVTA
ncbi:hypothetical protein [Azospirillum brasilense]|uniref:Flagellar basal-body protein FlbY n=1 Tax=Azospirillum brasilense TaxID=192 RepID=A0A235HG33_AZOBR|nr:hypothetical protein [Azospirillum brasilense]OYD84821.1 hypothetical protein CHT98_07900 [Azospirillum brasilense]